MSSRAVVITACSVASAAGYELEDAHAAWRNGGVTFAPLATFVNEQTSVRHAGRCPDPDLRRLPDRKVAKILRRKDLISLLATIDVARRAGLEKGKVDPNRFGMYVGTSSTQIGDLASYYDLVRECADGVSETYDSLRFGEKLMGNVNPLVVLQTLMNNGLCFGAMTLDIRGVNTNFMDFHVAGLRAVGEAFRSVATGRADVVIAGGIAVPVEPFQLSEGVAAGHIAKTRDLQEPLSASLRPYDEKRVGTILSEGSAYVVVESEEHALKRGATPLARIEGFALCSDGTFDFQGETRAPALGRAMTGAMREAGRGVADLGLLVGHGNGSPKSDLVEARAYAELLGARAKAVPLVTPKAALGDMCEAGGPCGLVMAIAALAAGEAPPTFNFTRGDEFSRALSIAAEPQKTTGRAALVTARNFLGLSAALAVASV